MELWGFEPALPWSLSSPPPLPNHPSHTLLTFPTRSLGSELSNTKRMVPGGNVGEGYIGGGNADSTNAQLVDRQAL